MNVELLKEIDAELVGRTYRFEWVKGHANHPLNEAADARARAVAEAFQRRALIPSGPGWVRDGDPEAPRTQARSPLVPVDDEPPAIVVAPQSHPELFSFDDSASPSAGRHTVTLSLDSAEHERLVERAKQRGVSVEELLRSWI
jgi:ribonuclease HI